MTDEEIRALALEQGDETDNGFMFNKEGQWTLFKFVRAIERAAYERAAQQCKIVGHNVDTQYHEACDDCANAIRNLM